MKLSQRIARLSATIVVLLAGVFTALAQYPAPVDFSAKFKTEANAAPYVLLNWKNNPEADAPVKYNVYRAMGETEDQKKFDKIGSVVVDPAKPPRDGIFSYMVKDLRPGVYTFFVKGVWGDNEGARTVIKVVVVEEPKSEKKVIIVSTPAKTGKEGKTYEYKVKAETNTGKTISFKLVNGPEGMTINKETGVIRWEKPVAGRYEIVVEAWVEFEGKVIETRQSFVLEIGKGEDDKPRGCAFIYGNVEFSEQSSTTPRGYVLAFRLEKVKKENGEEVETFRMMFKAEIKQGSFMLELPEGTYKLRAEGENFLAEWNIDKYELADADVLTIECNSRTGANFVVDARPEPKLVSITGRVFDAETMGGLKALVVFEARSKEDAKNLDPRYRGIVAETNADGIYEANLQAGINYIAFAKIVGRDNTAGEYLAEYWNNTNDATQASTINITEAEDGVDFPMDKRPTYENGFSGMLKNAHTGAGVSGKVIAYRIVTKEKPGGEPVIEREKAITVETDDNFGYSFSNLVPGTYIVFGVASERTLVPGWMVLGGTAASEWRDATRIEVGEVMITVQYDVNLDTVKGERGKGRVRGFVYDKRGGIIHKVEEERTQNSAAILGSLVVARDAQGNIVDYSLSTDEGAFEMSELLVGTYTVTASRVLYTSSAETVVVESESVEQEVSLGLVQEVTSVDVPVDLVGTSVNLFPNPATNNATVQFVAGASTASVRIVSPTGVVLATQTVEVPVGAASITLNTTSFASGVVMVHVTSGATSFALPLQIVR